MQLIEFVSSSNAFCFFTSICLNLSFSNKAQHMPSSSHSCKKCNDLAPLALWKTNYTKCVWMYKPTKLLKPSSSKIKLARILLPLLFTQNYTAFVKFFGVKNAAQCIRVYYYSNIPLITWNTKTKEGLPVRQWNRKGITRIFCRRLLAPQESSR